MRNGRCQENEKEAQYFWNDFILPLPFSWASSSFLILLEIMIIGLTAVPSSSTILYPQDLTDFVLNAMQLPNSFFPLWHLRQHFSYRPNEVRLLKNVEFLKKKKKSWILSSSNVLTDSRRCWLTTLQPLLSLLNKTRTSFKYSPSKRLRGGRPSLGWNVIGLRKEQFYFSHQELI